MNHSPYLKFTPWDSVIFGIDTYEIVSFTPDALHEALNTSGHYTIKVDPLASKKLLHTTGFYYCDTLIEPYCRKENFIFYEDNRFDIAVPKKIDTIIDMCHQVFLHGRFHRDFNIKNEFAEKRYTNWLQKLHESKKVYELLYEENVAGFIATDKAKLVLHTIHDKYRGQRIAKFFWSKMCKHLFTKGHDEITSSISAANLAVVNLYASLGFRFRNPVDIYHQLIPCV